MFAIVPLLPDYVHDLHLSKTQVGLVVGIYSGAVLVFSVPVGYLADRVGARRLTIVGVALLAAATFGCAFAGGFWALLLARAGQGLSSAISWTAALAWLSEASEPGRRGRVLGTAMSFATVGTIIGPVVGGLLGGAYSLRTPFILLGSITVVAHRARVARARRGRRAAAGRGAGTRARRRRKPRRDRGARDDGARGHRRRGRSTRSCRCAWVVDGYSAAAITVVLTTAGVVASASNYGVGLIFDRFGGIAIALVAIVAMAAFVAALAAAPTGLALAIIFVASTPAITGQYAVAFPLCAEGADAAGLAHANVFGLLNLAWGAGFLVGPAAGAALAQSTSDEVTYVVLAILSLLAALALRPLALS